MSTFSHSPLREPTPEVDVEAFRSLKEALDGIGRIGHGCAMVYADAATQLETAKALGEKVLVVEIGDVLSSDAPNDFRNFETLVVTGYISNSDQADELAVQSYVRAAAHNHFAGKEEPAVQILVLCSELPSCEVFNYEYPWYNGPFISGTELFGLENFDGEFHVTSYELGMVRNDGREVRAFVPSSKFPRHRLR